MLTFQKAVVTPVEEADMVASRVATAANRADMAVAKALVVLRAVPVSLQASTDRPAR